MQYIYNFPELQAEVWAGNMDWFRTPKLFQTKLSKLQGVERIIINGPIHTYKELQDSFQARTGLPILSRKEVGKSIPSKSLCLYFVDNIESKNQFILDFDKQIGEYGEILAIE